MRRYQGWMLFLIILICVFVFLYTQVDTRKRLTDAALESAKFVQWLQETKIGQQQTIDNSNHIALDLDNTEGKVLIKASNGLEIDKATCVGDEDFVATQMKYPRNIAIFIYDSKEAAKNPQPLEDPHIKTVIGELEKFPGAVFIDVGSNVGAFSIATASSGYRTFTLDADKSNIVRVCATMDLMELTGKMTIMYSPNQNICLDDISETFKLNHVVMKLDAKYFKDVVMNCGYGFFTTARVKVVVIDFANEKTHDDRKIIVEYLERNDILPGPTIAAETDFGKWDRVVVFYADGKPVEIKKPEVKPSYIPKLVDVKKEEEAYGKVVSLVNNKWTADENFCNADTTLFATATLNYNPNNFQMYVYPENEDKYVSGNVAKSGTWEPEWVKKIMEEMKKHPNAVFLDIGSHVGVYTMAVASMNRKVISVDFVNETVVRLCNSVKSAGFSDRVAIVKHALSMERTNYAVGTDAGNIAGTYLKNYWEGNVTLDSITLSDLLSLFKLKEVVIKMDVSAHEGDVLQGAANFFSTVKIHYCVMQYSQHKGQMSGSYIRNYFELNGMEANLPEGALWHKTATWPDIVEFIPAKNPLVKSKV